jgi:lipopolysaccharide/colanic/teichoic acid biosynthesis glycosyltransferase
MAKRLFDVVFSLCALLALSPVLLLAAIGIRLSSRGPILYRARRAGKNGEPFVMHKFRTMHAGQAADAAAITSRNDRRVFAFGRILRRLKVDELPELYDVARGKMSLVGPRPEDLAIVRNHYAIEHMETLKVRPGLASPGSIYNYTHGEQSISAEHPEEDYLTRLLPMKLALETVYVREASLAYDMRIVLRTLWVILLTALGKRNFRDPPEMRRIDKIVPARVSSPAVAPSTGRLDDVCP